MATQVKIKRGTTNANAPTGLTAGEMAINLVDKKLYVGGTAGTNVIFLDSTSAVGLGTANTFTALQSFSAGISASGATFSSDITVSSMTVGRGNRENAAQGNIAIGSNALKAADNGGDNIAIGDSALFGNLNGNNNVAVGNNTLYLTGVDPGGHNNVGVGFGVLYSNNAGSNITAIGASAGSYLGTGTSALTPGNGGIYVGYQARGSANTQTNEIVIGVNALGLGSNTAVIGATLQSAATIYGLLNLPSGLSTTGATFTGSISGATATFSKDITVNSITVGRGSGGFDSNVAVGNYAFNLNSSGENTVALGSNALQSNTTGNENTAVGGAALQANTTGNLNVGVGEYALSTNTIGSNKTAIGSRAGSYRGTETSALTTGTGGIYIGYQARGSTLAQTNEIVIGVDALGLGSNTAVIGATLQSAATIYGVLNLPSGLSASGATFSGNISAPNIVTVSTANTFTALQSFSAGISASALTVSGTITSTQGITFGSGTTFMAFVPKTAANDGGLWLRDGLFQVGGAVLAQNNGSLQYNMNSERFAVYGYQVIDNAAPYQGTATPLTVKGGTGQSVPLFNVTRGGTSAVQVHQDGYLAIPVNTSPAIKIGNHASRNLTLGSINGAAEIVQTGNSNSTLNIRQENGGPVSIGDSVGANNGTYIDVTDADAVISLNAGEIQINGPISTPLTLANAENIQNTVNGRIDFMPGPTAASAYGLYADFTGWGYGVQMGTINSAGTLDSSPGGILLNDNITILQDKFLSLDSDGTHALVKTSTGLDTLQIAVSSGVGNSNAVAIVGNRYVAAGTANRSPVTSHTNPNLYIYRAGITSANDFIRIEHDGTNGNIVAGGTSGIKISGLLDVASGLIASGATFSGDITVNSVTVGRGGGGDYRNTAVGKDALLENTGIGNVGMGTYALGANTSGSNKTAIGYAAGYYRGSGGVSTLTTGTGGIYIGYQARGSADTQTNEIVIGVDALGLGSNTAVIGATLQSAATIYGVLNLPSGLSASGATFSATTASTSSATGAVIIAGGVGIAKDSYINGHRIGQGLSASQTNLAVGTDALNSTTTGSINNVAVGYFAGKNITSGLGNVMLGAYAGQLNTTGQSNMCIGEGAHYSNQTGSYNVAIGGGAGHEQNNGSVYNVFLGSNAGYFIASGSQTTCVGGDAGRRQADGSTNMTASSDSVYIGYNAKGFNNSDSNTIVIGSNAIGLGANKTAIGTTFTTETKLFGVLNLPSGLSAAGATFSGTVNIGTTALISAPSATALAIQSQIPAGTGVTPTIQVICPSAGYTLTNQIATQKVFDLPQDTITLQAATTYMFEGQYLLTTGTTTHITSMSFVLTTATMTNCSWTSITGMPTALNAATSGAFQAIFNSVAGGNVNTTSTSANTMITFKGIMRVNVGGTMVPNIAFSAQPGGTNTVLVGSYLKFYPIGSNTINSVGTAIG
jgi:hypothetical protein